jgi:hypothetical protein
MNMSETRPGEIGSDEETESPAERSPALIQGGDHPEDGEQDEPGTGADGKPMVSDPEKADQTEPTGGWGTGTPGSSNVAGLQDVAPIESDVIEADEGKEQVNAHNDDEEGGRDG